MFFSYRRLVNRKRVKDTLIKIVDGFFTGIGLILLVLFMIIAIPLVALIELISGDR